MVRSAADWTEKLIEAIRRGQTEAACRCLQEGADPNARFDAEAPEHSPTVLIAAAYRGLTEVVVALLAAGADPNALQTADGYAEELQGRDAGVALTAACVAGRRSTASVLRPVTDAEHRPAADRLLARAGRAPDRQDALLLQAARTGNLRSLQHALQAGACPSCIDPDGDTPLHLAAEHLRRDALPALLSAGADPNAQNDAGETPLHLACRRQWREGIEALAQAGSRRSTPDGSGRRPAELVRNADCAEALLAGGEGEFTPEDLQSLLLVAARSGATALAQRLVEQGANPLGAAPDPDASPLVAAAGHGAVPLLESFTSGSPLDWAGSAFGSAALLAALQGGHRAAAAWLLERGVSPDAGSGRETPLTAAAKGRFSPPEKLQLVILLIQHRADVNRARADGVTPLMAAAAQRKGGPELVRLLLEHGADPNARDAKGQAVLEHAAFGGEKVIRLLIARGADPDARCSLHPDQSLRQYLKSLGLQVTSR